MSRAAKRIPPQYDSPAARFLRPHLSKEAGVEEEKKVKRDRN